MTELLVVVHPGSLCGPLRLWDGKKAAAIQAAVAHEIAAWRGKRVIVSGDWEFELKESPNRVLELAVRDITTVVPGKPTEAGLRSAARKILVRYPPATLRRILVTGAWTDPGDGCVTCTAAWLSEFAPGVEVGISPYAPSSI